MGKIFTKEENQAWSQSLPGKMCSACLIIKCHDEVLMIKARYKDHWTFPSGIVDINESPMSTAIRETKEETGLAFNINECRPYTTIYTSAKEPNDRDRFNFSFIVELDKKIDPPSIPNDEIKQFLWTKLTDIARLSNNKGSYQQFQQMLLDEKAYVSYKEI